MHPVYLIYRVLTSVYTITIFSLILTKDMHDIMAYLTTWTYILLTLYFLVSAFNAVFYTCRGHERQLSDVESTAFAFNRSETMVKQSYDNIAYVDRAANDPIQRSHSNNISRDACDSVSSMHESENRTLENASVANDRDITITMKIAWVLGNSIQVFAIIVSLIYFIVLFPPIGHTDFWDVNLHGVNSFLVITDTCLTARPVRLLHVFHPMIYGVCYVIFSVIYWSYDHVNNVLYPNVLDWNYPGTTMIWVLSLAFVAIPLFQLIYFGLYRLKLHIYYRYIERNVLE